MPATNHIVQRVTIAIDMLTGMDYRTTQDEVADVCRKHLEPVLDMAFNRYSGDNPMYISKLEIDLGLIPFEKLNEIFIQKMATALSKGLDDYVSTTSVSFQNITSQTTEEIHPEKPQPVHSALDLVLHYLQTGLFPWWAQKTTLVYLTTQLRKAMQEKKTDAVSSLSRLLQSPNALRRIVNTFYDTLLIEFTTLWIDQATIHQLTKQNDNLTGMLKDLLPVNTLRQYGWMAILENIAFSGTIHPQEWPGKTAIRFVELIVKDTDPTTLTHWMEKQNKSSIWEEPQDTSLPVEQRLFSFLEQQGEGQLQYLFRKSPSSIKTQSKNIKSGQMSAEVPVSDVEKVYIENAGLVLLWPFIQNFFQHIHLLEEKVFLNDAVAERACLLLQYLVTDTTDDMLEAQLPLNKILCGVPLLQPILTRWEILPEEVEEADHLLIAALEQGSTVWKNLSVPGLRQAYLNRAGILSSRDGAWLLQIERKPYDILLERLPWSFQMIKLPWMEQLLQVQW